MASPVTWLLRTKLVATQVALLIAALYLDFGTEIPLKYKATAVVIYGIANKIAIVWGSNKNPDGTPARVKYEKRRKGDI